MSKKWWVQAPGVKGGVGYPTKRQAKSVARNVKGGRVRHTSGGCLWMVATGVGGVSAVIVEVVRHIGG